eukprot:CAMPEP_0180123680 /NCGR_PEP_ID=MMETSP0986-20121125/4242_1 /TAXON_ID=697907 /ORGANISM="non described non described, Strain CCMP2293" /LENGTH=181 /DNA_ID=CAMNT_0022062959 /DNA_START=198 /DNA_END=743 /DNA_ORIENTATION=-
MLEKPDVLLRGAASRVWREEYCIPGESDSSGGTAPLEPPAIESRSNERSLEPLPIESRIAEKLGDPSPTFSNRVWRSDHAAATGPCAARGVPTFTASVGVGLGKSFTPDGLVDIMSSDSVRIFRAAVPGPGPARAVPHPCCAAFCMSSAGRGTGGRRLRAFPNFPLDSADAVGDGPPPGIS